MAIGILESICFVLNWSVIVLCLFMKVPQIKSSFGSMDTKGISLGSVLLEMLGYSVLFCYSFAMNYPIGMYLEQGLLLIQNFFLLGLIIHTRNILSPKVFCLLALYMTASYCVAFRCVPDFVLKSVVRDCLPAL
ncbi:mannose-P-dolichol utilization defect 1 protein-like isoform X2 [Mercenaria mercenaria]|uniref:mannose-P-dolichol utilization defect 1 protein-like isoform X2 n=1 Tax=Mercenaria mercenaria TaxID=6596 RepID=UPI00234EBB74|nr:mannose-P-dolichol utilization defect 1 protein-like isoform X2 [Mercenaria mercenaria]